MRDAATFWDLHDDGPAHPPLAEFAVKAAERALGVELPASYLDLLRVKNGGRTRGFVFPTSTRTSWAEDHVPLDELFGIGSPAEEAEWQSILCTPYMTREWGLPPRQVLLTGDGHWWITLDYRRASPPQVCWIDVEMNESTVLAASFRDFLCGLLPEDVVDPETSRIVLRSPD